MACCEGGGVSSTTSVPFPGRDLTLSLASCFRASVRILVSAIPADYRAVGLKPFPSSESSCLIFPRDRRTVTVRWTALECRRLLLGDSLTTLSTELSWVRGSPSAVRFADTHLYVARSGGGQRLHDPEECLVDLPYWLAGVCMQGMKLRALRMTSFSCATGWFWRTLSASPRRSWHRGRLPSIRCPWRRRCSPGCHIV